MDNVQTTDHRHVFVVGATTYPELIDSAILARFAYKIEIPLPTTNQRTKLFKILLGQQPRVDFDVEEMADELSRKAGGISGRDINRIVCAASQAALERALAENSPAPFVLTRQNLLSQLPGAK